MTKEEIKIIRQAAIDNLQQAIVQCGGNYSNINFEALLNRLGFPKYDQ